MRPMDAEAAEAFAFGQARSAAFRDLVAGLDTSNVITHVVTGETWFFATSGTTRLVGAGGARRYVRVVLRPHMPVEERAAVLAHELQHVREIAQSKAATQAAMLRLFDAIGRPVHGANNAFETADASDAGMRVWRELKVSARDARRRIEVPAVLRAQALTVTAPPEQ